MATYVLIHGAGSDSTYWGLVRPLLEAAGHRVITPDLPVDDDNAGLAEYKESVLSAAGKERGVILVAQSMGGFTAPLVVEELDAALLILVAAMIPAPGESPGDWWTNTGSAHARRENDVREGRDPDADFDPLVTFLHDLEPEALSFAFAHEPRPQSDTPFAKPWPLERWPEVTTEVLICSDDRFFPVDFMRRVCRERLGITPDEMECGHLPALAQPKELMQRLEGYRTAHGV